MAIISARYAYICACLCALNAHMCLCVCLFMCVCVCVQRRRKVCSTMRGCKQPPRGQGRVFEDAPLTFAICCQLGQCSVCLTNCLSVCLSLCLFVSLSVGLPVCFSLCPFVNSFCVLKRRHSNKCSHIAHTPCYAIAIKILRRVRSNNKILLSS